MAQGVTIDFTANLVKFTENVDKMAGNLDKFQGRVDTMASNVNKTLAGLGVGLSVAGLASFFKSGIDAADALSKLSSRTGVAVEDLAGLKLAADLSDTSIEQVAKSVNKLSIQITQNSAAYKQLGIDAKDPLEAFLQFSDVFAGIEDDQQRAAIGTMALGEEYAVLAPLLLQGSAALREQIAEGQSYNQVTQQQAEAAAAFNDELTRLQTRVESLSINFAGPALEALNGFYEAMQFATTVTKGFDPLSWLEAGSYGASGKAGQIEYLNQQIDDLTQSIEAFKTSGKTANLLDTLFGDGSLGEQKRKLDELLAVRDKLTKPAATTSDKTQVAPKQSAINNILNIKNDEESKVEKSAKKSAAAIKTYASEIDTLNKKLLETSAALEKSRPENLLQLNQIGASETDKSYAREKALRDKAIEFDKAKKSGDTAGALRIAQEREKLAFQSANQDIYAAQDGELPSYKIDDAKIKYKKAIEDSKKALAKFQASGGADVAGEALGGTDTAGITKSASVPQKTDLQTQISDAEKLKTLLADIQKPVKINIDSNVNEQVSKVEELQKRLADINANTTGSNNINTSQNAVDQSLSTEVLKRGARV